jgi:hypothetical protein
VSEKSRARCTQSQVTPTVSSHNDSPRGNLPVSHCGVGHEISQFSSLMICHVTLQPYDRSREDQWDYDLDLLAL